MRKIASYAIAAVAIAMTAPAIAATTFNATLNNLQEVPTNNSTATGTGRIVLSDDSNSIMVTLSWTGLSAPAAAGHIHCCSVPGVNSPVAIDLAPTRATSGSIFGIYDLTSLATYANSFRLPANGGSDVVALRNTFLAGLNSNRAYFNLHNANFPGGEIRGNLTAVPEPASWAMMITGFGLIGATMRRKKSVLASA